MSKKSFKEWDKDYNETYEWYIDGGVEYREKETHRQRRETCESCASQCESEIEELEKKLDEAVLIMSDLEKEKAFACRSFICDSCPITCYDIKTKRLKMFISINKEHLKGVKNGV